MNGSKLISIFGVLLCFVSGVTAHDADGGSYRCTPANLWTVGEKVTIEFRVDNSKFPSECAGTPNGLASFQSSPDDGITPYISRCTLPTSIVSSCSFTSGAMGCGCTNSNDNGYYVIEYNFVAAANQDRWWKADIACQFGSPTFKRVLYYTGTGCCGVTINDTVTPTPTPATTTPPPPEPCKAKICWILFGVLVGSAVVTIVIIVVLKLCGIIVLEIKCGQSDPKKDEAKPEDSRPS